ncbi:MAG: sigma factor-like helix-turn-helix DNA-binding protein [Candidatus Pacearchaeota archaeon]
MKEKFFIGRNKEFKAGKSEGSLLGINSMDNFLPDAGVIFNFTISDSPEGETSKNHPKNPYLVSENSFTKTRLMKRIEAMEKFAGKNIQDILLDLYWGEEARSLSEVGQEIGVKHKSTVAGLIKRCNIRIRTTSEAGILAWQNPEKREKLTKGFNETRYQPFKNTWERKNEELKQEVLGKTKQEQRKKLKGLLRKEGSIGKVVKRFKKDRIEIGMPLIQRWIDELDIPFFSHIANGMLVREAEKKDWLCRLTPTERKVLELRYPQKGPKRGKAWTLEKIGIELGNKSKEWIRQKEESALLKLRKIRAGKPLTTSGGQRREVDEDKIIREFKEGKSLAEIGQEQGVSRTVVRSRLIELGIYRDRRPK